MEQSSKSYPLHRLQNQIMKQTTGENISAVHLQALGCLSHYLVRDGFLQFALQKNSSHSENSSYQHHDGHRQRNVGAGSRRWALRVPFHLDGRGQLCAQKRKGEADICFPELDNLKGN